MFIFDGNPNGRIMCELSNWNGRVYKILRNDISEFAKRSDTLNTGIYFYLAKTMTIMKQFILTKPKKCLLEFASI